MLGDIAWNLNTGELVASERYVDGKDRLTVGTIAESGNQHVTKTSKHFSPTFLINNKKSLSGFLSALDKFIVQYQLVNMKGERFPGKGFTNEGYLKINRNNMGPGTWLFTGKNGGKKFVGNFTLQQRR